MTDSMNLVTAQISFLEPQIVLIHIPILQYPLFIQPILRLLFGEDHDEDAAKIPWCNRHEFLNISITPVECSITCARQLADRFIKPVADLIETISDNSKTSRSKDRAEIYQLDYTVIQVDGQGLDAGQRVLELTSPLAMAGISIFFLTTYFSDYILVPTRARRTVTRALEQRGFVFSHTADAFVSQLSPSSPTLPHHSARPSSSSSSFGNDTSTMPSTPPAKDIPELQARTFAKLKSHNIMPSVDKSIRLANCAGSREYSVFQDEQLKNDLMQVLLSTFPKPPLPNKTTNTNGLGLSLSPLSSCTAQSSSSPDIPHPDFSTRYLSITITATEPISVLLEHHLLPRLGSSLLGAKALDDALVPITLDLRDLPMEATGIVCGVAGRLAQGTTRGDETRLSGSVTLSPRSSSQAQGGEEDDQDDGPIEISFLSTARAGTVIVKEGQLESAMRALEWGMREAS